jgi:uncharacterized protein (TIGR02246 family)
MHRTLGIIGLVVGLSGPLVAQRGGAAVPDTVPAAVVQRFVDAANARDVEAMAALLAPEAVFARFPGGGTMVEGRDGIRAMYAQMLPSLPEGFRITVSPRIIEGEIVIDQEHFTPAEPGQDRATWIYQVRGGLIQRAWVVQGAPSP